MNIKRINQITTKLHKLRLKETELMEELCILVKEDSSTSKTKKVISNEDNGCILINGIYWDKENLIFDSSAYFTFDEAQKTAKAIGKRCPTTKELKDLLDLGHT